jgi:hypothetical protein
MQRTSGGEAQTNVSINPSYTTPVHGGRHSHGKNVHHHPPEFGPKLAQSSF